MEFAEVHAFGDLAQLRLAMVVLSQKKNGFFDSGVIFHASWHRFHSSKLILLHLEAFAVGEQPESCLFRDADGI
jgi:hypothetical protein